MRLTGNVPGLSNFFFPGEIIFLRSREVAPTISPPADPSSQGKHTPRRNTFFRGNVSQMADSFTHGDDLEFTCLGLRVFFYGLLFTVRIRAPACSICRSSFRNCSASLWTVREPAMAPWYEVIWGTPCFSFYFWLTPIKCSDQILHAIKRSGYPFKENKVIPRGLFRSIVFIALASYCIFIILWT